MFKIINKSHITAVVYWGRESERCQTRLRITRVLFIIKVIQWHMSVRQMVHIKKNLLITNSVLLILQICKNKGYNTC